MNIKPLGENVIIKQEKVEEKSKTGIILSSNKEEQTLTGEVLSVGKNVEDVKVGDKVVYAPYSGKEIGGMLIIGVHDIMGIIEKERNKYLNARMLKCITPNYNLTKGNLYNNLGYIEKSHSFVVRGDDGEQSFFDAERFKIYEEKKLGEEMKNGDIITTQPTIKK